MTRRFERTRVFYTRFRDRAEAQDNRTVIEQMAAHALSQWSAPANDRPAKVHSQAQALDILEYCRDEQMPPPHALVELFRKILGAPPRTEDYVIQSGQFRIMNDPRIRAIAEFEASQPRHPQHPSAATDVEVEKASKKASATAGIRPLSRRQIERLRDNAQWVFGSDVGQQRNPYYALVERLRHDRHVPPSCEPGEFEQWRDRLKRQGVDYLEFFGLPHLTSERIEALVTLGIRKRQQISELARVADEQLEQLPAHLKFSAQEAEELIVAATAPPTRRRRGRPPA